MAGRDDTHLLLRAFADELVRCGVTTVCTSPGSRSAPLVLALVRDGRLRTSSHVDERCAAFFALGAAKASGRPAVVCCTSGTATANFAPAVVEAHEAGVPLLVLTADRPPELREVGAGQAVDQLKLYGSAVRWFFEVGTHDASAARTRWFRALACRAVGAAQGGGGRPGPVHLNFPLREPLVPDGQVPEPCPGRPGGRPWVELRPSRAGDAEALVAALDAARRGVVVAGRVEAEPDIGAVAAALAERLRWPLLADPLSGARRGAAAVAHYDLLLRPSSSGGTLVDLALPGGATPDHVLRIGDLPTSKPLRQWLAGLDGVPQTAFAPAGVWHDPDGVLSLVLHADPAATLDGARGAALDPADPAWLDGWRAVDAAAAAAIDAELGAGLSEPRVARALGAHLPPQAALVVASSMPVRDVEGFVAARDDPPRVLANRGANGIDGTVSTAYGVASEAAGPTVLLLGDVALLHDVGGLLAGSRTTTALTIVVLDNDGGGIFEFLPVATQGDAYVEHVATPHGRDLAHAAALYGARHERPRTFDDFTRALVRATEAGSGTTILEIRTERGPNRELHRRLADAVAEAVAEAVDPR